MGNVVTVHDAGFGAEAGSTLAVVALVIFGSATLLAVYETVRLWFNPRRVAILVARMKNGIGRGDEILSRAHVRAMSVICVIGLSTTFGSSIINSAAMGFEPPDSLGVVILLSIPANVLMLILWWSIVYFNQPKFLVPRHMRSDSGLRAARRSAQQP